MAWTEQQTARMKGLLALGRSLQDIADAMGVSKSAISNRLRRLGLRANNFRNDAPVKRDHFKPRPGMIEGFMSLPLTEIQNGMCRWPEGDGPFVFCGQPCGENVYCEGHSAIAYRREKK